MPTYPRIGTTIPMAEARSTAGPAKAARARQMGAEAVRVDFYWQDRQPLDRPLWATERAVVAQIIAAGLKVLPVYGSPRGWAHWQTQADRQAWAGWAGEGARIMEAEFGRSILAHQIGNEPNKHLLPAPRCADLIKRASDAIRAGASRPIVSPGISPVPDGASPDLPAAAYLTALYRNGCLGAWDVLALHAYSRSGVGIPQTADWQMMLRLIGIADAAGDRSPVWLTEFGAPSIGPGCSEARQAAIVGQALAGCPERVRWVWVYKVDDHVTFAPGSQEGGFGAFRVDGAPKPVAAVIKSS